MNITGTVVCPKCNSLVFIGDPLKGEENSIVKTARELKFEKEKEKIEREKIKRGFTEALVKLGKTNKGGTFSVPWDRWRELGFAEAFVKTTKEIALNPEKFFKGVKHSSNPNFIPIYGIVAAFVAVLFQTFWSLKLFQSLFPSFTSFQDALSKAGVSGTSILADESKMRLIFDQMHPEGGALFMHLILTPFMTIVVTAFILHLGSVILGSKARLTLFYKMSGFIAITGIFNIFPIIGNFLGFLWKAVLVHKGGKVLNGFEGRKAYLFTGFYIFMQFFFSAMGIV
ncbi:MAG: hypothetical protein ACOX2F_06370 [bacterium]